MAVDALRTAAVGQREAGADCGRSRRRSRPRDADGASAGGRSRRRSAVAAHECAWRGRGALGRPPGEAVGDPGPEGQLARSGSPKCSRAALSSWLEFRRPVSRSTRRRSSLAILSGRSPDGSSWQRRRVAGPEKADHVVVRQAEVSFHVRVGQRPPAVLASHLGRPLPARALREPHHPAKQPPVGPHAEDGRGDEPVEMGIGVGVARAGSRPWPTWRRRRRDGSRPGSPSRSGPPRRCCS